MIIRLFIASCLGLSVFGRIPELMCYECSRGSRTGKQQLADDYFDIEFDQSAQRAIKHVHEACGSNTTILDRTYRAYCPALCQITYLLHDPDLTVISSCQSGNWTNTIYKKQFILATCAEDLCNNFALNQDSELLNNYSTNVRVNKLLLLSLLTTFLLLRL